MDPTPVSNLEFLLGIGEIGAGVGITMYLAGMVKVYQDGGGMEEYKATHPASGQLSLWPAEKPSYLRRLYTALNPRNHPFVANYLNKR